MEPGSMRFSGSGTLHLEGLDFKQFSFDHATQDLQDCIPHRLWNSLAFPRCYFPLQVSPSGYLDVFRVSFQPWLS